MVDTLDGAIEVSTCSVEVDTRKGTCNRNLIGSRIEVLVLDARCSARVHVTNSPCSPVNFKIIARSNRRNGDDFVRLQGLDGEFEGVAACLPTIANGPRLPAVSG